MTTLSLQETMDRLLLLIRAGYPVIYIVSHEETRVLDYLTKVFRVIKSENGPKRFVRWYHGLGLEEILNLGAQPIQQGTIDWLEIEGLPQSPDTTKHNRPEPMDALNAVKDATPSNFGALANTIVVFFDIHPYLRVDPLTGMRASLIRPVRNAADKLRQYYDANRGAPGKMYKTIVIVAPSASGLSPELERDLIVIDFPLPEGRELRQTLDNMLDRHILCFPNPAPPEDVSALCDTNQSQEEYEARLKDLIAGAGRGLTLEDYKLGLNMFAVRQEPLCARHVEDMLHLKAKAINNQALQYTPHVQIELGGLETVKLWTRARRDAAVSPEVRQKYFLPPPRGVLLCGASGGGKSQLAKLMAKEFNLALLRLDVGTLFGMYVGESEERTRVALRLAEVLAPVVLWLDEVDKAFKGMGGGGDNGVSARVFGYFLTWLAEKQDSIFVVATANDFRTLLAQFPEFGRKGRFDEIFWIGLPDEQARKKIFEIYLRSHYENAYLRVAEDDLSNAVSELSLAEPPSGDDDFECFCSLLSNNDVSGRMTGAEIEYAVTEALYEAYQRDRDSRARDKFVASMIVNCVRKAKDRVLYRSGSPDAEALKEMEKEAESKSWLFT
ncbi:MAG: AAA family ATPase [Anaerolineae bacterium]|nr:AAA family ATPase [Anaerolineae bacterium]